MGAQRIRRLAAKGIPPEGIATRLGLRPAVVRRVLGRSSQRGAPRTRGATTTVSFATSPEVAALLRKQASKQGVSVSSVVDRAVRAALSLNPTLPAPSGSSSKAPSAANGEAPQVAPQRVAVPRTAADAPESVRRLLKSYVLENVHWEQKNDRHVIVVAILTRGDAAAKKWLWTVLSRSEVRALVKEYRGSGCAEPERVLLRKQLRLTTTDIPRRAYLGLGWDAA